MDSDKDQMLFVTQGEYDEDIRDNYYFGCLVGGLTVATVWFALWLFRVGSF